jgi:hypothetical protein
MIPTMRIASPISDDNALGFIVINESDFDASTQVPFDVEPPKMNVAQLRESLTSRGIEFASNASKPDLQALLDAAPAQ